MSGSYAKGRRQNTSVETSDFLQKIVKCMLVEFCRSVTPLKHVRVKGHLGDDRQLLLYYTWLCLFVKDRQQRIAADLRYSRLSLEHFVFHWLRKYTIDD